MRRLTNEEFVNRVMEKGKGEFIPLSPYVNKRTKVKTRHSCGYEWETLAATLTDKPGCPKCTGNYKKTTDQYKEEVKKIVGDEYEVISEYNGNKNKVEFIHKLCGHNFQMEAKAFLLGQRCPECRKILLSKKFRKTHDTFLKEVELLVGRDFLVLTKYQGKDVPVEMKHTKCERVFKVTPNHFLSSMESRCPYCKSSKGEKRVEEYLINRGIYFKKQYRIKDCKNKRTLPFDFAVFDNGKLKALIEYDGIQHYKPKWGIVEFERTKKNDEIKNQYCQNNGIPLIRIHYEVVDIESALNNILYGNPEPSCFRKEQKV